MATEHPLDNHRADECFVCLRSEIDRLRAIAKEAMGECGTSSTTHHLLRQIVPDWNERP